MRRTLLIVGILALTVSVGAQVQPGHRIGIKQFSSTTSERKGDMTRLSGNVKLWIGDTVVTADEALIDLKTDEIELRGNVRMKPSTKR